MTLIIAAVGLIAIAALFAALSGWEAGRRRRMVQDVTKQVRRYDLHGDLLPPQETSLGPVDYRRLPEANPAGYIQTTQQARYAPSIQASFGVPVATAITTAIVLTLACAVLAWALGWPVKVVAITFALSLVGAWLWRLGLADKTLWKVEQWTGKDFDGDGHAGRPAVGFATVNPGQARATRGAAIRTECHRTAQRGATAVCGRVLPGGHV